jgi:hypothetical protein
MVAASGDSGMRGLSVTDDDEVCGVLDVIVYHNDSVL